MNNAAKAEVAEQTSADLERILAELYELAEDAEAASLHRCQLRIERAIATLSTARIGLNVQAGKLKSTADL